MAITGIPTLHILSVKHVHFKFNLSCKSTELTEVLTKAGRATRVTSKNLNCLTCKGISEYKDDEYMLALCNYYEKLSNEENEKDGNNKERY